MDIQVHINNTVTQTQYVEVEGQKFACPQVARVIPADFLTDVNHKGQPTYGGAVGLAYQLAEAQDQISQLSVQYYQEQATLNNLRNKYDKVKRAAELDRTKWTAKLKDLESRRK